MKEIDLIAAQIKSAYQDGGWCAVSPRDTLRSLSAAQAAAHPIANAHSAWEIALHIGFWHDAVVRRLAGDPVHYEEGEDFPAPAAPTPQNWNDALDAIDRGLETLVATVRALDPSRLEDLTPGKQFTVRFMLHGISQHDLYHCGQVILLKKLLDT